MNNEEKILSYLEKLTGDVGKLTADVGELKAGQQKLEADVEELKAGQLKLEAGQKSIRKDIKDLQIHVHAGLFKGEILRLDRRIDKLDEVYASKLN